MDSGVTIYPNQVLIIVTSIWQVLSTWVKVLELTGKSFLLKFDQQLEIKKIPSQTKLVKINTKRLNKKYKHRSQIRLF